MGTLPALRSLLDPAALEDHVRRAWGLPRTGRCFLLRSLVNDVYRLQTGAGGAVLKVYGRARTSDEAAWEADLVGHLRRQGVPTPEVLPLPGGGAVSVVAAPEGERAMVLLRASTGRKPAPPFAPDLRRAYGAMAARFHLAAAGLRSAHGRPSLEIDAILERTLPTVLDALRSRPRDGDMVAALVDRVRNHLDSLGQLEHGLLWGDVSLDNLHLLDDGSIEIHDFDAAGRGPLAADLWGPRLGQDWPSFLDGYRSVRPLEGRELEAVDWMVVPQVVANMEFRLGRLPSWRGELEVPPGSIEAELETLRGWAREVLGIAA
ncbi:MAG TPA: phosphotransferase [Candidatus Dormibacteraeota bacterium]|nr:phosphotransferase [Candidatus Dormibacteraeota bacterium]